MSQKRIGVADTKYEYWLKHENNSLLLQRETCKFNKEAHEE